MKLVLFDVDGTLVDSQNDIVSAMTSAYDAVGLPLPDRERMLSIVGLSLPQAMAQLEPGTAPEIRDRMVEAYKHAYMTRRAAMGAGSSPLYPGARAVLDDLAGRADVLLGVATGKSLRGLDALIDSHDLRGMFVTRQVADHHPSKPHPSMILTAMAETGVAVQDTVMIGDTSYDMEMAAAAGVPGIGVTWGYHLPAALGAAHRIIDGFADLPATLETIWSTQA